jgi:AcrR family transcriptional regulator
MKTTAGPLSGRRAQAARNDERILEAARAVFLADPGAPISEVAKQAKVGIGALYRRFASKEEVLRRLSSDGLSRYIAEAEAALADDGDPWSAFVTFMHRILDADTHSLTLRLAGTFTPPRSCTATPAGRTSSTSGYWSARRPPARSATTSTSTTCPSCSSRSRPSGPGARTAPASSATGTWLCSWMPYGPRRHNRCPALRPPGRK